MRSKGLGCCRACGSCETVLKAWATADGLGCEHGSMIYIYISTSRGLVYRAVSFQLWMAVVADNTNHVEARQYLVGGASDNGAIKFSI